MAGIFITKSSITLSKAANNFLSWKNISNQMSNFYWTRFRFAQTFSSFQSLFFVQNIWSCQRKVIFCAIVIWVSKYSMKGDCLLHVNTSQRNTSLGSALSNVGAYVKSSLRFTRTGVNCDQTFHDRQLFAALPSICVHDLVTIWS